MPGTALTFVRNINSFYTNKKAIEALRARVVPEPRLLDSIEVPAAGIVDPATGRHKLEHFQRRQDGKTPIKSTDELYAVAEQVRPLFDAMLREVANEVGNAVVEVKLPPGLKKRDRAEDKARDDYSNRLCDGEDTSRPAVGWVFDIVRGMLVCESAAAVRAVVQRLVKDKRVRVVLKFKNRFKHPTPNGFCDMLVQLTLA